ncbi:MAG TPA: enoyl-CoA hydratase/isomerase family protein [Actinomycetota bacterium]|nr:enoyl-CoA hydratase/isomerase family protein [Actinomycetota bacterium]
MTDEVLVESDGPVRVVTINRPAKRNALHIQLRRALATAFARLGTDPDVGVVVLAGAGSAFCSGMDTTQFGGDDDNRRALFESSYGLFEALRTLPKPVIAAVNGPALAAGFALAAFADIRIAGPAATFGMPEVSLGFASSWATLARVLPDQLARRMAFTGETIDAATALEWGLVMEVAPDPLARARALAGVMAANPVPGLEGTKRLMVESADPALRAAWETEMRIFHTSLFRKR